MIRVLKKITVLVYIVLEMLKFFICITTKCVKLQQNYLFKKRYKKSAKYTSPKKTSEKNALAQNCFNLTIQNEITTKLFLYKKRQKIYLPYKSNDSKKLRQL